MTSAAAAARLGRAFGLAPVHEPPWQGDATFLGVPATVTSWATDGTFVCCARPGQPWPLAGFPLGAADRDDLLAGLSVDDPRWLWIDAPDALPAAAATALVAGTELPVAPLWTARDDGPAVPAGGALYLVGTVPADGWPALAALEAALGVTLPRLPVTVGVALPSGFPLVTARVPLGAVAGVLGGAVLEICSASAPTAPDRVRLVATLRVGTAEIDLDADVPRDGVGITATGRYRGTLFDGLDVPGLDPARVGAAVSLRLSAADGRLTVDRIGAEVDLASVDVVPELVVLDAMRASLTVLDPLGDRTVHAAVAGQASLGRRRLLQLVGRGDYPGGVVALGLAAGTSVDVVALLADLGVPVDPAHLPALTVLSCEATVDTHRSQLAVQLVADCAWTVGPFTLRTVSLGVDRGVWLTTSLRFGALDCRVAATHDDAGWSFTAAVTTTASLGELLASVVAVFGGEAAVPDFLNRLTLREAGLAFADRGGASSVRVHGEVDYALEPGRSVAVAVTVNARRPADADGWTLDDVHGVLTLDGHAFALDLDEGADTTALRASYPATEPAAGLDLGGVAAALGVDLAGLAPALVPTVTTASFAHDTGTGRTLVAVSTTGVDAWLVRAPRQDGTTMAVAALGVTTALHLGALPVVGPTLAELGADVGVSALRLLAAAGRVTARELRDVLKPPATPALDLGDREAVPAAALTVVLDLGGRTVPLMVATGATPLPATGEPGAGAATPAEPTRSTAAPTTPAHRAAAPAANRAPTPTAQADVGYVIGPVSIRRVTASWSDGRIWITLDAGLTLAGLELDLIGLAVGFAPQPDPRLEVALRGLAVSSAGGPVRVSGGLAATATGGTRRYDGQLTVEAAAYQLAALASYTEVEGAASVFGYAVLGAPLGGPVFCRVTGLAAGFGVNRGLVLPEPADLMTFPLVAAAMGDETPLAAADPAAAVEALGPAIPPLVGANWFAVGIRFTSFELLHSFALVTASFGRQVEIDLLGVSVLSVPPLADEPIGYAELALRATVRPEQGVVDVSGRLTPASFLFSRDCHLTGGFAFRAWFADDATTGAQAGEFVVTLGGYHPALVPRPSYPQVPRLAATWQVSPQLAVKGTYYFALTPSAVMAGGSLEATWRSGDLAAWFTAHADFLLCWKPFHYQASIGVSLGVSFRVDLWITSFTVTLSVGVDLDLWGPPFGGRARVDLGVVSFTIGFGADPPGVGPIPWTEFASSFLPPITDGNSGWCFPVISGGLVKDLSGDAAHAIDWVVSPETFALTTVSVVPCTDASLGDGRSLTVGSDPFGVGPVGLDHGQLTSTHEIVFTRGGQPVDLPLAAEPVFANVPAAAWSPAAQAADVTTLNGPSTQRAVTGFTLRPRPVDPDRTLPVELRVLVYTEDPQERRTTWAGAAVRRAPVDAAAVLAALQAEGVLP